MKRKTVAIIVVTLAILSGCSGEKSQINEKTETQETQKKQETQVKKEKQEKLKAPEISETAYVNDDRFVGKINDNLTIHMQLDKDRDTVLKIYYYEQDKKEIELRGEIYGDTISVFGEGSDVRFEGLIVSDYLIEGIWNEGERIYPLYLIKGDYDSLIPKEPDDELVKWQGDWVGTDATYYCGSDLIIEPIFDNLIRFELTAYNGLHTGWLKSFAIVDNGKALHKGENAVELIFAKDDDGNIVLDTDDYTYYCGAGVSFASSYERQSSSVKTPTAKEVGLVYTEEQEVIFKDITGEHYETFINYAQYYTDEEDMDGIGAAVRSFGLRGYSNAAIVMIRREDNRIMAAVDGNDGAYYFTNNPESKSLPRTIKNWQGGRTFVNIDDEDIVLEKQTNLDQDKLEIVDEVHIPQKFLDFMRQKDNKNSILL